MASIYVASSHKNTIQPGVVRRLRAEGHEVFDFRNPAWKSGEAQEPAAPLPRAFPGVPAWTALLAKAAHRSPSAQSVLRTDMAALEKADTLVLVLPCGRGAHQELGWAIAKNKRIYILLADGEAPDLMHGMILMPDEDEFEIGEFVTSLDSLVQSLWCHERSLADATEGIARLAAKPCATRSAPAPAARSKARSAKKTSKKNVATTSPVRR